MVIHRANCATFINKIQLETSNLCHTQVYVSYIKQSESDRYFNRPQQPPPSLFGDILKTEETQQTHSLTH